MSEDDPNTYYIGIERTDNDLLIDDVLAFCKDINSKNMNGGLILPVLEDNHNFKNAIFSISTKEESIYINGVKLIEDSSIKETLNAIIKPWFLTNAVGNDLIDFTRCLNQNSQLRHISEKFITLNLFKLLLSNTNTSKEVAFSCHVEASEEHFDMAFFNQIGSAINDEFGRDNYLIMTISPHTKPQTMIHFTCFYK